MSLQQVPLVAQFPTTAWSVIDVVRRDSRDGEFSAATNRLIAAYWRPVFRFLRSRGIPATEAEDLTQAFFLRMLEKNWVERADADRGRFRTFLLAVLKHFVADRGPNRAPKQDRFEADMVQVAALISEEDRQFEPPTNVTPETLFMQEWAQSTIAATCRRLRSWCEDQGRPDWYRVFEATVLPTSTSTKVSQREAAETLGLTRDRVRGAQTATREQFIRLLRTEVAGQVRDSSDIDDEIRELEGHLQL